VLSKLHIMKEVEGVTIKTKESFIYLKITGEGPALLLLHGFPQTHLMWRDITPFLSKHFTVINADLPGYGRSGCPPSDPFHSNYTKKAIAGEMVFVLEQLGFENFSVVGHDRGARTAYRLALDFPEKINKLCLLDIIPTAEVWDRMNRDILQAFWPWSLLSQPSPLPETLIGNSPKAIVDNALSTWGSASTAFPPFVHDAYVTALRNPDNIHAICEEFRAAATLDYDHDKEIFKRGEKITCPLLVLWSETGGLNKWYQNDGGPLGIWKQWARDVVGRPVNGGHFFPEEFPAETAMSLIDFIGLQDS
jgi:haloacetate dehalogenase